MKPLDLNRWLLSMELRAKQKDVANDIAEKVNALMEKYGNDNDKRKDEAA